MAQDEKHEPQTFTVSLVTDAEQAREMAEYEAAFRESMRRQLVANMKRAMRVYSRAL